MSIIDTLAERIGGGPRQRHRGRQARRRGGEGIRALPPPRGSLRTRPRLHRPLLGQREGQRREQGRLPQEEPIRPRPVVPRRPRVQPQATRGPPRPERGQAPLQARHARARAVRRGQGGALAAAAGGVLVREAGDQEAQQAGNDHGRRAAPLIGRPRLHAPRGRRRPRRPRRRGLRLRDRGGRRRPRCVLQLLFLGFHNLIVSGFTPFGQGAGQTLLAFRPAHH